MTLLSAAEAAFPMSVPVIIAGGGACGLVAALAAHDAGCEVVVIERDPLPRGSTSMSLGALCAVGTADQARHGIDDNADIFFADVMAQTKGTADPVVARVIGAASGPAINWLRERHDVPLTLDTDWPPSFGHSRMRMHVTPGRSGADLMDRLLAACDRAEIPVIVNACLSNLFVDRHRVAGVRYARPDGSLEDIRCDALIVATCGFGGNHAMLSRHIPEMAQARYFGWEGNQGDGIQLGAAMGGALADMDAYQGLGLLAEPAGIDLNPRFLIEGGIQVNRDGLRFSNELDDLSGQGARVMAQPESKAWVIFDERIHRSCLDLPQYMQLRSVGGVQSADNATALAQRTGVNERGLTSTLKTIHPGVTDQWGRAFTRPALAPPFHAVLVSGALFHTQGGLVIDAAAHVVDGAGQRFPNLFAGGGAARGISGRGPSGYLPGSGLCSAVTLGYIAGQSAAAAAGEMRSATPA
ncbi:FAD-dependent oxidoreductase [Blastomonas fulva]|uniref:FAD-dependent oxidoreductase n=1 Tax=Blastomonas fulva TaxID=1550728 RepID=UPI003F6E6945